MQHWPVNPYQPLRNIDYITGDFSTLILHPDYDVEHFRKLCDFLGQTAKEGPVVLEDSSKQVG